jgi:UDP-2-acetamido-3-amino-2,3-dideoxy-glucuronate N-acetyltransferase
MIQKSLALNLAEKVSDEVISIGANSTIVCGITVGKYSMIAAGSVVTKNVNAFTLVAGNPAVEIAKINKKGSRI